MVRCEYPQCETNATYNYHAGGRKAVYCRIHAQPGMVNVCSKRC
ncbi:unnamed protein product, partial [Laminaria digitata]